MIKKLSFIGILAFLGLFFYFYRNSGKFRKSIIAALVALFVFGSVIPPSRSIGGADGFTPLTPQEQSRPNKRPGFFSGRSNNNGPGKPI